MPEDEMVSWHHRLDGHEFEQALGVGDGQGSPAYCSPWSHKESDMTEKWKRTELSALHSQYKSYLIMVYYFMVSFAFLIF